MDQDFEDKIIAVRGHTGRQVLESIPLLINK